MKSKTMRKYGTLDPKTVLKEQEKNNDLDTLAVATQFLHNVDFLSPMANSRGKKALMALGDLDTATADGGTMNDPRDYGYLFSEFFKVPFPEPENPDFTFIDLFAGMGGFRLAMRTLGGKCVFSSEWNKFAQKTYFANFGEMPFGDITQEYTKSFIPDKFDILCAGFPCQPFSIAGVSKKKSLGRETGFRDKTQGTLFFEVADIISRHRPKTFYLENVKNLVSHDKGNTFRVIKETLEELDYSLHYEVIDGKSYVPQHRERIMIVGFDRKLYHGEEQFAFPITGEPVNCVRA